MKIGEAVRLVLAGSLPLQVLWAIATDPERIQAALILGRVDQLPRSCRDPAAAYASLNPQQQRLVQQLAPLAVSAGLPAAPPLPGAKQPTPRPPREAPGPAD